MPMVLSLRYSYEVGFEGKLSGVIAHGVRICVDMLKEAAARINLAVRCILGTRGEGITKMLNI